METDRPDAALKEAARVAALKRVSVAKLAAKTGGNYELATQLVDAIYAVFPARPEKPAKAEQDKPDEN